MPVGALRGIGGFLKLIGKYDVGEVTLTLPTRTFDGELTLDVGGREIRLIEVGPAHTEGDLIVHVPDANVVYAADIMFVGVAPIMWVGPVANWIAALDRITELAPAVVVPGHGPPTDLDGVARMREYWTFVADAVGRGLDARAILRDPGYAPFAGWDNPERVAVSAALIARGGAGRVSSAERLRLIAKMGALA